MFNFKLILEVSIMHKTSCGLNKSNRYSIDDNTVIQLADINRSLSLYDFEAHLVANEKQKFLDDLNNYKKSIVVNKPQKTNPTSELLEYGYYLYNSGELNFDYHLCFRYFINESIKNNLLHPNNKDNYIKHFESLDAKVLQSKISLEKEDERKIDFSLYQEANWKIVQDNIAINVIYNMSGFVGFSITGKILLSLNPNSEPKELSIKTAQSVIKSKTGLSVKFTTHRKNQNDNIDYIAIPIEDLMLLEGDDFRPDILAEYYQIDGAWYRNRWKPTELMKLKAGEYKKPEGIFRLIYNLVNYDQEIFHYFINWLAYFFQGLKKSTVAMVFISKQGTGKGIFVDEILKPLFNYSFTVNSESLSTKYKGGIVKDRLFLIVNESDTARNGSNKSFTKQWITDKSISAEVKGETLEKEIEIFAQTLFFSNERVPVEIDKDDRRFTVKESGSSIKDTFLGYGTYENLISALQSEIKDFAIFLKSHNVDYDLVNKALSTPEKTAIIYACNDSLQDFADAIENRDINFFQELKDIDYTLYCYLDIDFKNHRIQASSIHKIFTALYAGEKNKLSPKALMAKLRLLKPHIFLIKDKKNDDRWIPSDGKKYYRLP